MGWIGCIRCKTFWCDFVAWTFALIAPVQPVLQLASCSNETIQNAPRHYETHQIHEFRVQWVGSGAFVVKKFRCDFMARTGALIAPVQSILHRVSCSNEILPNILKHHEKHQNMSLGSNGVDWVCSLRKIRMRLHGTNFCIICSSSTHFVPSFL